MYPSRSSLPLKLAMCIPLNESLLIIWAQTLENTICDQDIVSPVTSIHPFFDVWVVREHASQSRQLDASRFSIPMFPTKHGARKIAHSV